jgi:hypothetical protein
MANKEHNLEPHFMKLFLSPVNHDRTKGRRIAFLLLFSSFLMPVAWPQVVCESRTPPAEKVLAYLRSLGNGSYMFGQMATWVHNENPDMDHRIRPGIAWMWLKNWKPVIPNWQDLSSGVTMGIIM